ncbi:Short-chain dehydrogenase [Streptomyces sp. WMMB 714]|uniref:SDR family NAD(P)-dependent oxidoreductase n=1 Tax=Streptomyces sp. WMMB 714 TaxID=1286822 RepID=UPI0005F7A12A|nr:SDR family NAD(P)-dependent oxidoreductase [Streptomyces sp. WMMB 714]SCK53128.1 Short-chain dehydrogenase [Streptomyces sp. WMMB 714]
MHDSSGRQVRNGAQRPVALITGASSGIGTAVAEQLASEGSWRLLLNGRDEERLSDVAVRTRGTALPADITDSQSRARLAREALAHGGRVDALVAGAGIGWAGPFTKMPAESIDRLLEVNLTAVIHLVRLVLPGMIARRRGSVVLIGSVAGSVGVRDEAVYAATKGGLIAFADSLRYELAASGVRVSVVMPGAVDTPFFSRRGVPYGRTRPRPVPAGQVAAVVRRALVSGRSDSYVPGWLSMPARLHGVAPGLFRSLAQRFG